ncbi:CBS domain-containing protein [Parabacteroides pacaensis]|uniref:CBS domain-containing protein n=1 Tax=Parabacteroides pacaensis TaxID=2086575 RepID=UPI000D0F0101|nr:CBS domain-containing protein [Parabacteroides pacaensis]
MLVKDFITKEIPVLKSFETGEYALALMDDFKLKHLPVLENNTYQCLVSERDIFSMRRLDEPVGSLVNFAPSVTPNQHLYEVLRLVSHFNLTMIPVLNEEKELIGGVTRERLIDVLAEVCCVETEGSVLVLEMAPQDYELAEIARIIESNNAHVMSLFSRIDKITGKLIVTIKIDLEDISPVIRSFERFNYTVLYYFMKKGMVDDLLQKRMDELLFYMNM